MSYDKYDEFSNLWISVYCCVCGHYHSHICKLELLEHPMHFKCASIANPCAHNCSAEWDFTATGEELKDIKHLKELADRTMELEKEISSNYKILKRY